MRSTSRPGSLPRTLAAVTVLGLSVSLTACTGGEGAAASPTGAQSGAASPTGAAAAGQAASPTPAAAGSLPVVATASGTLPEGTVDVAVHSLVRDPNGRTMTLRAAFTPHVSETGSMTLSRMNGSIFIHPVLLDRVNLKRYSVIRGSGIQDWLTNKDAVTVSGQPLESWFVYAAPQDDIASITLTMDAWGVEIADVPITGPAQ